MQHRTQKLTTKFLLRLSFRLAEKNIEILAQRPSLNGLSIIRSDQIFFCPNVGPRNKKLFLNPPMYDMPITEENGRVTIGAS